MKATIQEYDKLDEGGEARVVEVMRNEGEEDIYISFGTKEQYFDAEEVVLTFSATEVRSLIDLLEASLTQ